MTIQIYQAAGWQLLAQARAELAAGDARQASEKGWGAAAQMVKAIAEQRGWQHSGHRQLFAAVRQVRNETGNEDIRRLFNTANALQPTFTRTGKTAKPLPRTWMTLSNCSTCWSRCWAKLLSHS